MYSRSYNDGETGSSEFRGTRIPTGYDGTALSSDGIKDAQSPCEPACDCDCRNDCRESREKKEPSFFDNIIGIFGGKKLGFSLSGIDTEDLLLIGLALFLFISKNHDRECALMIAALLFIR